MEKKDTIKKQLQSLVGAKVVMADVTDGGVAVIEVRKGLENFDGEYFRFEIGRVVFGDLS